MPNVRQSSFLGGELSPLLWGRTDSPLYAKGLRACRNFFLSKHGSAVSRPGSVYLGTTRNPIDAGNLRLIPFVYSDTDSFVIEVGMQAGPGSNQPYFRFYTKGAALTSANIYTPGPYELLANFTSSADLQLLKWAQTGDVLTLTHPDWPAMELRRLADWDVAALGVIADAAVAAADAAVLAMADGDLDVQGDTYAPESTRALAASSTVDNAIWVLGWYAVFAGNARAAYVNALQAVYVARGGVPAAFTAAFTAGDAACAALPATSSINAYNAAYLDAFRATYFSYVNGSPHWTLTNVVFAPAKPYFGGTPGNYPLLKFASLAAIVAAADASHPLREWIWLCTLLVRDVLTGRIYETLPWRVSEIWSGGGGDAPIALTDNLVAVYPDKAVTVWRSTHANLSTANVVNQSYVELCMNVYRGRGDPKSVGVFGFVGSTTSDRFIDTGTEPDFSSQPPCGTNPFLITDYAGANPVIENPRAVAFFQDRRAFLATPQRPTTIFLSAIGEYTNYDRHPTVPIAGEALLFELAARRFEQGIHLLSHQKMLVGTRSSVWSFGGSGGGPLDFDSVEARVIDEVGMTDLPPLILGGTVLYCRAKGTGVRSLAYAVSVNGAGTYSGSDVSGRSDHLFIGNAQGFLFTTDKSLVDWAYAEDPWGLVWAVRADGSLLSLTYDGEEAAWARHDGSATTMGPRAYYHRICSVPEGNEDAVYMIVTRGIAGSQGQKCIERMASRVRRDTYDDDICLDCAVRIEQSPISVTVTGINHLKGESVYVIAQGNAPQGPFVVDDTGTVTLNEEMAPNFSGEPDDDICVMYVGLLFTPELEGLEVSNADARMRQKNVKAVGLDLFESRGLYAGQNFDALVPVQRRKVSDSYDATQVETGLFRIDIKGTWDEAGRWVVRQKLPLPVTVVGVVRELEVGDR